MQGTQIPKFSQIPSRKENLFSHGKPLVEGDLLIQKDLARTLEAVRDYGPDGFYKGWVARATAEEFSQKGLIQLDLESYDAMARAGYREL